ncbi:ubiquinol oxidase subunit II [Asticcacaulis sp. EMRT-3]|uniref:ubiquinol oxidase subunit II n=1 Tax=Asticcacaulis sp. EMRT-3 TaxID=3040349 RepID=UPI0024AE8EFD|nr:ubiquinol oxidase subunit II [Asticcacaulis sp. EMRT-3]MDI7773912.1 ubiquinol oxidase subunit II [Asticcacaulis sp. EMRT-3]
MLSGCKMALMDPQGPIGAQEKDIILLATGLMLIVVIPVILMTIGFAWKYRESNRKAVYAPDWEHSTRIEAVVWAIPCLIILALATVTWISTHQLDPYKPLTTANKAKPVEVQVVSLDWKWLFIYPQYGVASVNQLALPVGTPVHFDLTSATVMNSFFIPQLGSQIYTMTGMQTQLSLIADHPGAYDGMSANYSGIGFAGMKFKALAMQPADFDAWMARAKTHPLLDSASYAALAAPSEKVAVAYYGSVDPHLYHNILNKCADGSPCTDDTVNMAMMKTIAPDAAPCKNPSDTHPSNGAVTEKVAQAKSDARRSQS